MILTTVHTPDLHLGRFGDGRVHEMNSCLVVRQHSIIIQTQEIPHRKIEERRILQQCCVPHLRKNKLTGEWSPGSNGVGLVPFHRNVMITVYTPDRALDRGQCLRSPGRLRGPQSALVSYDPCRSSRVM